MPTALRDGHDALAGIKVLDLGQYIAGPMLAMFLGDFGADVVRVDPPGGPRWKHTSNAVLQRGKRVVELDLKSDEGLARARDLIEWADVVIDGFRPGVLDRLGLSPEERTAEDPRLIWCSLPAFGSDDPRATLAGWEGVVISAAGLYPSGMEATEGDPRFTALPLASCLGAFVCAHRVAAALFARERHGHGERIEVPLFDACFQLIGIQAEVPWSKNWMSDRLMKRVPGAVGTRKAGDGRYLQNTGPNRGVQKIFDTFAPQFKLAELDGRAVDDAAEALKNAWARMPAAEWERFAQEELGAAFAAIQTTEEWLQDEHALDSRCVVPVHDPQLGQTVQAGFPVLLSRTPPRASAGRAEKPTRAEAVLAEARSTAAMRSRSPESPEVGSPLDGVRVVDASTLLAGPTSTRILAQYGADVVKLEKAGLALGQSDPLSDDPSALMGHRTVNAGKRMLMVDLKSADGQAIVHRMIESADILHHNFPEETADRLQIGKAQARSIRPDLICSRVSLHSNGGSRENYRGHEPLGQAVSGISHRLGGEGPPTMAPLLLNDMCTGHLSAFGIILALLHRLRTGETQDVNAALSRTSTMLQMPYMLAFEGQVWDEPSGANVMGWGPLDRLYRGSDGWLYLAMHHEDAQARLAEVEGLESANTLSKDRLGDWLAERFLKDSVDTWVERLVAVDAGAHRYTSIADLVTSDDSRARHLTVLLDHPGMGKSWGIGMPRLGGRARTMDLLVSRRPGMDSLELLEEFGFTEQMADLLRNGVVAIGEAPLIETRLPKGFSLSKGYWDTREDAESFLVGDAHKSAIARIDAE